MNRQLFVILPTYNGDKYLAKQIESIQNQTIDDWILVIRDDGSTDNTIKIIHEYLNKDHRIIFLKNNEGNLGTAASFSLLIEHTLALGADYISFSDQDDIWLPKKLETSMNRMYQKEQKNGINTPVLVHTDLEIVSASMETISTSFMVYENIRIPSKPQINNLLVQNYVVGCTMLGNRALLKAACPVPNNIRMHDWWIASYAVLSGELSYIAEPTIRYRQHSNNTLGVAGFSQIYSPFSKSWLRRILKRPKLQAATTQISESLCLRFKNKEQTREIILLNQCNECLTRPIGIARIYYAKKLKMGGQNWLSSIIFYILLLFSVFR